MEALRETITNAICHRDYGSPHTIQIQIIDNRIIICSPGELPFDMSIDKLLNKFHPSRPRNKIIAQAFYDMHLTEFYGSGIRRIRKECEINGNAFPTLSNEAGSFTTTYFSRQKEGSDTINSSDDTINSGNDTIKGGSDTINDDSDTINSSDDTINSSDDTINLSDDTINLSDDTINPSDDTINPSDDTINLSDDTINPGDDTINQIDYNLKQQLLKIINQKEGIKRDVLAVEVKKSIPTVARLLADLEKEGIIIYRGSKKTGGYYPIEIQDSNNK